MTKAKLTIEEIIEQLPNPYAVDYQCDNGPLDLYTDAEMVKFAHRLISAINKKLEQQNVHIDSSN